MTASIYISVVWVVEKKKNNKKKKNKEYPDIPTHFFQTCYSKHNLFFSFFFA